MRRLLTVAVVAAIIGVAGAATIDILRGSSSSSDKEQSASPEATVPQTQTFPPPLPSWQGTPKEIQEEEFPGPQISTPDEVVEFAHSPGATIYHAVGSAAMGPSDDDVAAPDLRVRGVDGLRVADISVLPQQVSGNTAAPAIAIGWQAADILRSTS
jgi:hypothetical protein